MVCLKVLVVLQGPHRPRSPSSWSVLSVSLLDLSSVQQEWIENVMAKGRSVIFCLVAVPGFGPQSVSSWHPPQQLSRRHLLTNFAVTLTGSGCLSVLLVPPAVASSRDEKADDLSEWFQTKLKQPTEERPAIPFPSVTKKEQRLRPVVQGVIYGPSSLPASVKSSSSYLLVQVLRYQALEQQLDGSSSLSQSPKYFVESSKIPLSQLSFPFQFQFNKISPSVPQDMDLVVRARIMLDLSNGSSTTGTSAPLFCTYLEGEGVAKAFLLPSANINSNKNSGPFAVDSEVGINGVYVRGPAAVRLGQPPIGAGNNKEALGSEWDVCRV